MLFWVDNVFLACATGVDSVASSITIDEQLLKNRECFFPMQDYAHLGLIFPTLIETLLCYLHQSTFCKMF